jgi:paired amphipathic helix protein Sin3a
MTIQLLGKDDSRIDDSEMLVERWQAYVDSFVSVRVPGVGCCVVG